MDKQIEIYRRRRKVEVFRKSKKVISSLVGRKEQRKKIKRDGKKCEKEAEERERGYERMA